MPDTTGEKTEAPTPRRLQEARDEGQVARSPDLTAAVMLLGGTLLLGLFASQMFGGMKLIVRAALDGEWVSEPGVAEEAEHLTALVITSGTEALAPIALGLFALGIVGNVIQFGFMFTLKPLTPKLSKISPASGVKNLVSARALMKLVMSLGKVFIVMGVSVIWIYLSMPKVMALGELELMPMLAAAGSMVFWLSMKIAAVLIVLAILDFAYQKYQHTRDQRMTKEEVKQEMKQMDGDPLVKQRRAKVARQLAMQRMGQAVPKADVVVTNPTHFAVALKYDEDMAAPKVVAKGSDLMAMRIRQLAIANGVPIVERPPLARALFRHVEVGQEIPEKFYSTVAEILAYVYRISGKSKAAVAG